MELYFAKSVDYEWKDVTLKSDSVHRSSVLYYVFVIVIVGRFRPNIQKNCAFCDTSTKFGTHVH